MARPGRRARAFTLPATALKAGLQPRERLLAAALAGPVGPWVLASTYGLVEVALEGRVVARRPWHDVDAASWERESSTLTVTWVDRSLPVRWPLADERLFLQVVRERVQASVVLAEEVSMPGGRSIRAVIRQDLATRRLFEQVVPGRGGLSPAQATAAAAPALARLRQQTGLPPTDADA